MSSTVYAILISDAQDELVVGVERDGKVTYGPGFTADTASKEFWEALKGFMAGEQRAQSLLDREEEAYAEHVFELEKRIAELEKELSRALADEKFPSKSVEKRIKAQRADEGQASEGNISQKGLP